MKHGRHMKYTAPDDEDIKMAGREMKSNPPRILSKTKKKKGKKAADKQRVAIMMSKARSAREARH